MAPLWCDLGFFPGEQSLAAANLHPTIVMKSAAQRVASTHGELLKLLKTSIVISRSLLVILIIRVAEAAPGACHELDSDNGPGARTITL